MVETAEKVGQLAEASQHRRNHQWESLRSSGVITAKHTLFPETGAVGRGRPRSVAAVEAALSTEEKLLAVSQSNPCDRPGRQNIRHLRSRHAGHVVKRMERFEDSMHIGPGHRADSRHRLEAEEPYLRAVVRILPEVGMSMPKKLKPRGATSSR